MFLLVGHVFSADFWSNGAEAGRRTDKSTEGKQVSCYILLFLFVLWVIFLKNFRYELTASRDL